MAKFNPYVQPGIFELFCGPMYSGKTRALEHRLKPLESTEHQFIFIRPKIDSRKKRTTSYSPIFIDENSSLDILSAVSQEHSLVAIDEIQFFDRDILKVINRLIAERKNVIAAGLDLDFRAEPFGQMAHLKKSAHYVIECKEAVCRYNNCGSLGKRTQRLIRGQPANYDCPINSVEGKSSHITYEPRCIQHHFVPGKPKTKK